MWVDKGSHYDGPINIIMGCQDSQFSLKLYSTSKEFTSSMSIEHIGIFVQTVK